MMGETFDHEMRVKLALAAVKYLDDGQSRAPLNEVIMGIQAPYIAEIRRLEALLNEKT